MNKIRIDQILFEKNFAETKTKAKSMIMAGQVFVNDKQVIKAGEKYDLKVKIKINSLHNRWVSRGALKLLSAINEFDIKVQNKVCMDIGASTGGFTHVLLENEAKKIYAVDVGRNQLHEKILKNNKVINLEKTNARFIDNEKIKDKIDIIVCDVSFISLKKVIEPCLQFLKNSGEIICLIKPQFEAERKEIKKGIVSNSLVHNRICKDVTNWFVKDCKMQFFGIVESSITGSKGNKEFLIYCNNYKNLKQ